ncbi:MAG: DUF2007 domain-containing protein [Bacteroidota bacterium]
MGKFTTIATFQYPHEVQVVKGKLESEGIEVFLKDELTIQVDNFLSNAMGGVKLQVRESDINRAVPILHEAGVLSQHDLATPKETWLGKFTAEMPVINKWPVEVRGIFLIGLMLFAIALTCLYFLS